MLVWFLARMTRLLAASWRVEQPPWPVPGPCVVAIWHGEQLPLVALHRARDLVPITSLSKDGEIVAGVLAQLGYPVIRGSSSRGGASALLAARRALDAGRRPVFAVDGPRGPAGTVQPGAAALARRAQVPMVWCTVEAAGWRAKSWDSFLVPWPFTRVRVHYRVEPPPPRSAET